MQRRRTEEQQVADLTNLGERVAQLPIADQGPIEIARPRLWCALPHSSRLVRFTAKGHDGTIELPFEHPTDVTFGGAGLDRLYVVAINDGLYVIDGAGTGRVEPRAAL